jgi:hypothetical protein
LGFGSKGSFLSAFQSQTINFSGGAGTNQSAKERKEKTQKHTEKMTREEDKLRGSVKQSRKQKEPTNLRQAEQLSKTKKQNQNQKQNKIKTKQNKKTVT